MVAHRYRDQVLEPILLVEIEELKKDRGHVNFIHNGAPAHCAKATKEWFEQHSILLSNHSPMSPDLNPIENIWHLVKTRIRNCER